MMYKENHVLSKCLLKRFADDNSMIARHGFPNPIPYQSQGFHKGLWQPGAKKYIEQIWSDTEGQMNRVFEKIDEEKGLTLNEIKILCKFMAAHYIRSNKFIQVYKQLRLQKYDEIDHDGRFPLIQRGKLGQQWLSDTGIPSKFFETTMLDYYELCVQYLSSHGFEIGIAETEEFILSDSGLLLLDYKTPSVLPNRQVALLQATSAVLPIGPRHIVAFRSGRRKVKYSTLTDTEVQRANMYLKASVIDTYYYRPR